MLKIELTLSEKIALEQEHSFSRDAHKRDRIKAVLLRSEDWTIALIAQALRLHETSITRHLNEYKKNKKLSCHNGGSTGYLNEEQTLELITHLKNKTYQYVADIAAYIFKTWDIKFSRPGLPEFK